MTKIEKLTKEQTAILPAKRDEWLAHGLSTQPADRPRAEAGLRAAYIAAGLQPPKYMIWLASPLAGSYGRAITPIILKDTKPLAVRAQVRDQVGDQIWAQIWAQVGDQVGAQVGAQVGDQIWAQVGAQVGDQVRAQIWDQVGDQVWAQVWDQVGAQVGDQVGAQVWDQVGAQVWDQVGAQMPNWYYGLIDQWIVWYSSWFDTMAELGVKNLELFDGLKEVAKSCGWVWVFQDFAILTERPTLIKRDQLNMLHCEDGPAIQYPDGFALYSWHGTRVPADLIEGIGWTTDQILREKNAEIRRCAIERMGWHQFIKESGMKQVGKSVDDPGNPGQVLTLYDIPKIFTEPVKVLLCTNATVEKDGQRHQFGITVPAEISDPIEAAGWSFGLTAKQYGALERAC